MNNVTAADWSYTEYAKLPGSIKDDEQGLHEAAKQFESLFINMWLKSAREANAVMSENSPFSSNELEMQQQMFDSQMAMHLAKEGGVGLAPTIVRQLRGGITSAPTESVTATQPVPPSATPSSAPVQLQPAASRVSLFDSPQEFVDKIGPYVKKIVGAVGLPPLAVMAQAALETGWGKSVIADDHGQATHNLFGVKATNWQGDSVQLHSKEFSFGQWQDKLSSFRSYPDWQTGIADYAKMVSGSQRYGGDTNDAQQFADQLQQGGYATDPGYAAKLKSIMQRLPGLGF